MDPTRQQMQRPAGRPVIPGTAQPPEGQAPPPPIPKPKIPLRQLDAEFLKDNGNEALDQVARIYAGRLHQLCLHVLHLRQQLAQLMEGRKSDMQQIDETFHGFAEVLGKLAGGAQAAPGEGPAQGGEGGAPAQEEQLPGEPGVGGEIPLQPQQQPAAQRPAPPKRR